MTKLIVLISVAISAVVQWKFPKREVKPPVPSIPPMPDPEESLESFHAWQRWAADYSPWSLR
jgi:hypothetical protein